MKATAFPSTFHSELVLSSIAAAKTMAQKDYWSESDLCCAISNIEPSIEFKKQCKSCISAVASNFTILHFVLKVLFVVLLFFEAV